MPAMIQDTGYKIQDTGYKIQDTGYKIQDTGYKIQDPEFEPTALFIQFPISSLKTRRADPLAQRSSRLVRADHYRYFHFRNARPVMGTNKTPVMFF
jgi:hypothetical protein